MLCAIVIMFNISITCICSFTYAHDVYANSVMCHVIIITVTHDSYGNNNDSDGKLIIIKQLSRLS